MATLEEFLKPEDAKKLRELGDNNDTEKNSQAKEVGSDTKKSPQGKEINTDQMIEEAKKRISSFVNQRINEEIKKTRGEKNVSTKESREKLKEISNKTIKRATEKGWVKKHRTMIEEKEKQNQIPKKNPMKREYEPSEEYLKHQEEKQKTNEKTTKKAANKLISGMIEHSRKNNYRSKTEKQNETWTEEDEKTLEEIMSAINKLSEKMSARKEEIQKLRKALQKIEEDEKENKKDLIDQNTEINIGVEKIEISKTNITIEDYEKMLTEIEQIGALDIYNPLGLHGNKDDIIKYIQKKMMEKELEDPKITEEEVFYVYPDRPEWLKKHFGDDLERQKEILKNDIKEAKEKAKISFMYLLGKIGPRELIHTEPYTYIRENINDEEAKKYADEEAEKWKFLLERIKNKYEDKLGNQEDFTATKDADFRKPNFKNATDIAFEEITKENPAPIEDDKKIPIETKSDFDTSNMTKFTYFDGGDKTTFKQGDERDSIFLYKNETREVFLNEAGWELAKTNPSYFLNKSFTWPSDKIFNVQFKELKITPAELDGSGTIIKKGLINIKN